MQIILVISILVLELWIPATYGQEPIAYTKSGIIRGKSNFYNDKVVHEFLGIPFGAPPVGDLRFRRPLPAEPQEEIDATQYGPACHQFTPSPFPWYDNMTNQDEDCLNLNIWVPSTTRNGTAVFYWIFSGGFTLGSNRLPVYHGGPLAAEGDVIVVTVNYRIGSFGFFYSGTDDAPGNVGLYDTLLGLQWVHDNIEAFGGDPNKITVGGHSAGSITASLFMVSPLTRGLYARVILQSGTFLMLQDGREPNLELGQKFAERLGCADDANSLRSSPKEVVDCLRSRDASELAQVLSELKPLSTQSFLPVFEDPIVGNNPIKQLQDGKFQNVNVLMGNTDDESVYNIPTKHPDVFGFFGWKDTLFNKSYASHLLSEEVYQNVADKEEATNFYLDKVEDDDLQGIRQQTASGYADFLIVCPCLYFGEMASRKSKVHYYLVKRRPNASNWAYWMGVVHFDEVQYVFGQPTVHAESTNSADESFSYDIMKYWSNFIKNGNPDEQWPTYTEQEHMTRILEDPGQEINEPGPHLEACDYLRSFFIQSHSGSR